MSFIFELPEVGEGVTEAELVRWLVTVGDTVTPGMPVCEVMTDKATMEINCTQGGTVEARLRNEGEIFPVHSPLLQLGTGSGTASVAKTHSAPAKTEPPVQIAKNTAPAVQSAPASTTQHNVAAHATPSNNSGKVLASPATRVYASEQGINLQDVTGSGKGGRITKEDVDNSTKLPVFSEAIIAPPAVQVAPASTDQVVKIVGLRRKIAEKMVESVQRAPHFTYVDEVDATELVAMRNNLKDQAKSQGINLTYIPFIMKALVQAFQEFPTVNSIMNETDFSMIVRGEVNIGIATDTPQGLYVPVVKNVERKSILELAREIADITERTRTGKIQLHELQGGTFTITSVGNIGGRFATPIINHPEVAILGVNQIHDRPMVVNGQVVARKMMYLSPSFDHRVIDGAVAARFVSCLKNYLENPASLLLRLR